MGVFSRARDIVSANLNAMLDRAEDPEKLIKLMIQEMEDTLVEIKASCAGAMAAEKRARRAFEMCRDKAGLWAQRAEMAVAKEREDLAREALAEKRDLLDQAVALEREAGQTAELVGQYQAEIRQLEEKLASAREKRRLLLQRHLAAQDKIRVRKEIRRFETADAMLRFDKLEGRIERMEADAELVDYGRKPTLEQQFERLAYDEGVERELAELKAKAAAEKE
ncbi:phage shock protein A, PspA [Desulfarculus baarsii DSM 2075]|uniref:Phage shock protein A, PspA n=1 Tax=Desulfarculus baarsii (strain ATCC 33931 / DSM 2075 / LMG 7858 / VKM B-1802 / 2st14) TaxID=644282 RepID=E1QM74_DESB2|nr:PspA/IM30 family protein [Desulfarculus baarsii]ADK86117.1 phage shock protein A, PspA [Desulfarculus baarsii DSM 2075]